MSEEITLSINGTSLSVPEGTTVAVALAQAGESVFGCSPVGRPRAPLCGMGTCFECRVTINGTPNRRSCITLCEDRMEVTTHAAR